MIYIQFKFKFWFYHYAIVFFIKAILKLFPKLCPVRKLIDAQLSWFEGMCTKIKIKIKILQQIKELLERLKLQWYLEFLIFLIFILRYQFNPQMFKEDITCQILLQALMNLPNTDFTLCKCLIIEQHVSFQTNITMNVL